MSEFIFYRRKLVNNKYKKIYRKGKSKKEYVKSQRKYVLLTSYNKKLKKKELNKTNKKGGNQRYNKKLKKLSTILNGGSIVNTDLKYDSNGNYIQSPECKYIYQNPEEYGITKSELLNTSDTAAVRIMEDRFPTTPSLTGGKKKKGGSFIRTYLDKINGGAKKKR